MYHISRFILLIFVLINSAYANNESLNNLFDKLPRDAFGIKADIRDLDIISKKVPAPVMSSSGKSYLTVNKMGFDVLNTDQSKNSWLVHEFLEFGKDALKPILDIGAGYGNISLMILEQENQVIANDIAREHLLNIRKNAISKNLAINNLYLNNDVFPNNMDFPDHSIHAVMLHRVLHFMSPQQIETGLSKISQWLVPGGKVFIVVMSPQHKQFSKWFLPIYEKRWDQGNKWPGENLQVIKALPDQAYNLPEYLHVMDDRPLRLALEKHGFIIERCDFISMKHFSKKEGDRDGNEAIGIIAVKLGQ